jgi:hypothetical protein
MTNSDTPKTPGVDTKPQHQIETVATMCHIVPGQKMLVERTAMPSTEGFRQYRRKQIAELRPYEPGETLEGVTVSIEDRKAGSPKQGDMIARNPKNHADQWLVSAQYFADNFEPVSDLTDAAE